jgi:phosphoribosyl 1,2-cyclic phosphate phosphodiesterase
MMSEIPMKVTFLGTGTSTGVPVVACDCEVCSSDDRRDQRLRTSALVELGMTKLVIDCGPDFRYQMIRERVEDVSAILFTHGHRDHIAGLDDVRAFNYVLNKTVDIFASQHVINEINKEFPYFLLEKRFFGAPQLCFHPITNEPFTINDIQITPVRVLHHKMEVFGFRIGNFTYITDASSVPDEEKHKIINSKILVINALRKSKHISHLSLQEALDLIEELKPGSAYITHLSHFMGLHQKVQKDLPQNVYLAYDGLKLEV